MTCTIPKRTEMLKQCIHSILGQTYTAWELLVLCDDEYEGQSKTINRIAAEAQGDWLCPFDDDDLMFPEFLSALFVATEDADIVYAPPQVDGEDSEPFHGEPPNIPTPALIRAGLWRDLGGYNEGVREQEDRMLWGEAMEISARFRRVDRVLWTYRFHGANKSRHGGVA